MTRSVTRVGSLRWAWERAACLRGAAFREGAFLLTSGGPAPDGIPPGSQAPGASFPPAPRTRPDREPGHLASSAPTCVSPGCWGARVHECVCVCVWFCLLSVPARAEKRRGPHENKAAAPGGGKQQEGPADTAALGPVPSKSWPRSGGARLHSSGCKGGEAARQCLHLSVCLPQDPDFVRTLAEKRPDAGWVSTDSSRTDNLPAEV